MKRRGDYLNCASHAADALNLNQPDKELIGHVRDEGEEYDQ